MIKGSISFTATITDPQQLEYLRDLERTLAFEHASSLIDGNCLVVEPAGEDQEGWFDLDSADCDLSQEVEYLDSRHLLIHHPEHPNWVVLCDEAEPCIPAASPGSDPGLQVFADQAGRLVCSYPKELTAPKVYSTETDDLSATVIHATGPGVAEALDQISQQLSAFSNFKTALANHSAAPTATERTSHARAKKV